MTPMDTELVEPQAEDTAEAEPQVLLGTYAPFDVSDQKEWTKQDFDAAEGGKLKICESIRAMVVAACQRESLGRRLEVEQAWRLQLMDRGFHRQIPRKGGGWEIYGQRSSLGIFGSHAADNLHDVNIIGVHNDIIVNALKRDTPKTEFSPRTDGDDAVTAAAQANKLKHIIAEDALFKERLAQAARLFCTDERVALLMVPVADAMEYGFEDDNPDVVPETEGITPPTQPSRTPRIQTQLRVFGKLEHKCRIACDRDEASPYQILAWEEDTADERARFPWIADDIKGGSAGIAEIELDRMARASINLAIQSGMATGQGNINDTTRLQCWLTPRFYWDDSCSKAARAWLLKTFPKGLLAVYSGKELAFARNESWSEVGTVIHARTGKGQNRRSLTEAYAGPNMVLDNLFDLIVKFFTATVPRNFYDDVVFNVGQLRSSGNMPGRKEPFSSAKVTPNVPPILTDPSPTHQPALPEFMLWLSGDLATLLTGAQLTLQGAQNGEGEQGTLGEAQMDNDSAMSRLSEPWAALCGGFSNATLQAVQWNARVQPKGKVFDRITKDQGRIRIEMANLNADMLVVAEDDVNVPESFTEREERIWQLVQAMPTNQYIATVMMNPANARKIKEAARMGLTIPGADSWEKQEGEFTLLLDAAPQPNPQVAEMQAKVQTLKQEMEQAPMHAASLDPNALAQTLQQGMQAIQQMEQQIQQLPPLVSSVPVRQDQTEEHSVEAACCLERMISAEGRRLANSTNEMERAAFQNLHLHWFEHDQMATKLAAANQQPVEPKASISLAVDKMPGAVQSQMLSKLGIAAPPEAFDEMGPHLVTHEVEGTNAEGAREKITTELAGKQLN